MDIFDELNFLAIFPPQLDEGMADFRHYLKILNVWRVASIGFEFYTKFWYKIANKIYCT